MSTIKATPDTATASVRLEISTSSSVQRVLRNDVNGIAEVRTLQGQLPTPVTDNEYRRNLVTNPSFGTNTTGWSINAGTGGTATLSRQTTGGLSGPEHLRAAWTVGATAANARISTTLSVLGKANDNYVFKLSFRDPSSLVYSRLKVEFLNASDVVLDTTTGGFYIGSTSWGYLQLNAQSSVDFAKARLVFSSDYPNSANFPKAGSVIDIDAVLFEKAEDSYRPYFDGSIYSGVDPLPGTLSWTGTAHASQSVIKNTGTLIITDYEAAAGTNTYSIVEATDTQATATAVLELESPWLFVPVLPNYSEKVRTIANYAAQRQSQSIVHRVIGRRDPLIAFGVLSDRTGTVEFFCESLDQARKLETVFDRGEVVMLKQNVGEMDMYFSATATSILPYAAEGEANTCYSFTVQYTEVKRPIGNLAGALGWTFDQLALSYASFDEVAIKFATFNDLTIQKEKI